jgi:hypothetical protein
MFVRKPLPYLTRPKRYHQTGLSASYHSTQSIMTPPSHLLIRVSSSSSSYWSSIPVWDASGTDWATMLSLVGACGSHVTVSSVVLVVTSFGGDLDPAGLVGLEWTFSSALAVQPGVVSPHFLFRIRQDWQAVGRVPCFPLHLETFSG